MEKKYDIFISSKKEDYTYAEEVRIFLVKNGKTVFLASKELQRIGEAEYAKVIDKALDRCVHMVVVSTSIENINSKWVSYEWGIFSNDLKSGYRKGNLITIIIGKLNLKDLPASLRHQQSFPFDTYQQNVLDFLRPDNEYDVPQPSIGQNNKDKIAPTNRKKYYYTLGGFLTLLALLTIGVFGLYLHKSRISINEITAIDLGLPSKTLWGDKNIGAEKISDFGYYYSWGTTSPIKNYHLNEIDSTNIPANISRTIGICKTSYDVASLILGGKWSLPSSKQFEELVAHCKWNWVEKEGNAGFEVIGLNGNSIFLPAAGLVLYEGFKYSHQFGYYWSGDCDETKFDKAKELIIGLNEVNVEIGKKYVGRSVRPVMIDTNDK